MSEVQGRLVGTFEEAKAPGEFWFSGEPPTRLTFVCPCGCGAIGGIMVGGDPTKHPVWQWNGNLEKPTTTPSIKFVGGCEWHGYLTDGVFKSC